MKANELMIGDWVQGFLPDTYSQVYGLINECRVAIVGGGAYMEVSNEDILPIPLTAEILEKNGFKRVAGDKYFPKPKYVWIGSEESECVVSIAVYDEPVNGVNILTQIHTNCKEHGGVNRVHNCDIGYVHELQHALRLCGLRELADNFKIECVSISTNT